MRSLGAESDRAYQGGPPERTFYQEASLTPEEGGLQMDVAGLQLPSQYSRRLDWFAVDLEGEHSAMDGRILEEHAEYVVYAIHRVSGLLLFHLFLKYERLDYTGMMIFKLLFTAQKNKVS